MRRSRLRPVAAVVLALAAGAARPARIQPAMPGMDVNPAAPPPPAIKPPEGPRTGVARRKVDGDVARQAKEGTEALLDDRPAEAMLRYDQAQVQAPDVAELAYNRGLAALLAGRTEEARQSFDLAQKLHEEQARRDPDEAPPELLAQDSRFNDGHAAFQAEELKQAVTQWASVVARDGQSEDARRNLELALRMLQVQEQQQQQQQDQQDQQDDEEQEQEPQPQQPDDQEQEQPQQPEPEEGEAPGQPEERPGEMSREQAEQLLEALESAEKQAMEEKEAEKARRAGPASGKIW